MLLESDRNRLVHMIQAAQEIFTYTQGRSREDLQTDRPLQQLVIRNLEILGEAAGRISEELKSSTEDIPWSRILGMRNRIVHAYHDIDLDIVWSTVELAVPHVLGKLQRVLERAKSRSRSRASMARIVQLSVKLRKKLQLRPVYC